tara:strand:- start:291 stop:1112 length:822 start_codon:yes stop_codon:yes gene_type:complete
MTKRKKKKPARVTGDYHDGMKDSNSDMDITGTDSEGNISEITGRELAKQMLLGNTRRLTMTREPDWTPFEQAEDIGGDNVFVNSRYQVNVRRCKWNQGSPAEIIGLHLSIKRHDKDVLNSPDDWRDKMRIKNEIAGDESEAIELYPSMSRVVDSANQYHLWCLPPNQSVPVGFDDLVTEDESTFGMEEKKKLIEECKRQIEKKGGTFDPVNNAEHRDFVAGLTSTGGKQRPLPSWLRQVSDYKRSYVFKFLVLCSNVIKGGYETWVRRRLYYK